MKRHFAAIAGLVALVAFAATARAQLVLPGGNAQTGRAFALEACTPCHAVGGQMAARFAIAPSFSAIANTEAMTGMKLQAILSTPHAIMPNIILTPEEMANVIAYIVTLRNR